jgi:hypothetical protein
MTWNGMALWVMSLQSWRVWSRSFYQLIKNQLHIFLWVDILWICRHLIMNIMMNTDFTCTEAMQVCLAWREDVILLLNFCVQFEFLLYFIEKVCAGSVASFFLTRGFALLSMVYNGLE